MGNKPQRDDRRNGNCNKKAHDMLGMGHSGPHGLPVLMPENMEKVSVEPIVKVSVTPRA